MKRVQFALKENKYNQAKKKLKEVGLTWQKVCEQLVDHIIFSEQLDEFGIPLHEMSPSVFKKAQSEIEGHFETAIQKYIQIRIEQSNQNKKHWMSALKTALKSVIKSNTTIKLKRGYFFNEEKLSQIFDGMWENGLELALDHLRMDQKLVKINKITMLKLFEFATVHFALKK